MLQHIGLFLFCTLKLLKFSDFTKLICCFFINNQQVVLLAKVELAYINKANEEGEIITVKLITWNTENRMSDSIEAFEEIKESLADTGIQFSIVKASYQS